MKKSAFSLVELSIVLIVIGILVATVSVSTRLIENSKIRSVIKEIETVKSSVNTFYASFDSYPGDFDRAANYFSGATNGDGDKLIEYLSENAYAWHHLQQAKVIEGNYSGAMTDSGNGATPDTNTLNSKYSTPACFSFVGNLAKGSTFGITTGANNFVLGHRWFDNACIGELFTPRDAEFVDLKLDDGDPAAGIILSVGGQVSPPTTGAAGATSASSNCVASGAYKGTEETAECILSFLF